MSLRERLSAIEHEQWVEWSTAVLPEVSDERRDRWRRFQVPYEELHETVKDQDRYWTDIVLATVREHLTEQAQADGLADVAEWLDKVLTDRGPEA